MSDQSQHGQSNIVFDLFNGYDSIAKRTGFVLEVGSMDGDLFSNAAPFFKVGWSGMCIEPDELSFKGLQNRYKNNKRIQTVNICVVPNDIQMITFYMANLDLPYHNHGLSTLDKTFAERLARDTDKPFTELIKLGLPLHVLFTSFINQPIDFMTIDCECMDEKILLGTNFTIFRPKVFQSEFQYDIEIDDVGMAKNAIMYLEDNGYIVKHIPDSRDILAVDGTNCSDLNLTNYNLL